MSGFTGFTHRCEQSSARVRRYHIYRKKNYEIRRENARWTASAVARARRAAARASSGDGRLARLHLANIGERETAERRRGSTPRARLHLLRYRKSETKIPWKQGAVQNEPLGTKKGKPRGSGRAGARGGEGPAGRDGGVIALRRARGRRGYAGP